MTLVHLSHASPLLSLIRCSPLVRLRSTAFRSCTMTCSRSTIGLQYSSQRNRHTLSLSLLLLLAAACVLAFASAPHSVAATGFAAGESNIPDAPLSAPLPALSWSHRGGSVSRLVATKTTPRRAPPAHLQQHQPTRHWTVMQATDESSTGAADSSSSSTGGKPIGTNEADTPPLPRGKSAAMGAVLTDLPFAVCCSFP